MWLQSVNYKNKPYTSAKQNLQEIHLNEKKQQYKEKRVSRDLQSTTFSICHSLEFEEVKQIVHIYLPILNGDRGKKEILSTGN